MNNLITNLILLGIFSLFPLSGHCQDIYSKTWIIDKQVIQSKGNQDVIFERYRSDNLVNLSNISLVFNADGTYTGTGLNGQPVFGNYTLQDGELALKDGVMNKFEFIDNSRFNLSIETKFLGTDTMTYDATSITMYVSEIALPISLKSFEVKKRGESHQLIWKSVWEENFSHFLIERSSNGVDFKEVGKVLGKGSNSQYGYIDDQVAEFGSLVYYRLKMVDFDESFEYSPIRTISREISNIEVFPNPAGNILYIVTGDKIDSLQIRNHTGQVIKKHKNDNRIDISDLSPGIYFLQFFSSGREVFQKSFIKS